MIAEIAILVTLALLTLPPTTALSVFASAALSGAVGCEVVCLNWVSPFLSSVILGFLVSMLSFVLSLSSLQAFLLDLGLSALMSYAYAKGFLTSRIESISEVFTTAFVLAAVWLAYLNPEASAQAMLSITGSLWTVDQGAAALLAAFTGLVMIVGSAYKLQLSAAMFDYEYLRISEKRPFLWAWLLFFFMVAGTSFASYTIGLLAAQVLIALPAAFSVKAKLRELERSFEASYSVAVAASLLGCWASELWGLPEVGVIGATLILLIVLLELSERIGARRLSQSGSRFGRSDKAFKQQKGEGESMGKG